MRRDPKIKKILTIDSQKEIVDKLNLNFLGIYKLKGGNLGTRGPTGNTGPLGLPGDVGERGNKGTRGTRWFIGNTGPQGGPGDVIINGDYWIDTDSEFSTINEFKASGWTNSGYNLANESEFNRIDGILNHNGATAANAIFYRKLNHKTTFNFSDTLLDKQNLNPLSSMFTISSDGTKTGGYSLIEFSRGDITDGTPSDYLRHPKISFLNPSGENSSITILVPRDELTIQTLDTTDTVSQDITFNVGENFIARASLGFDIGTSPSSTGGILLKSKEGMKINSTGYYKPTYKNFEFKNLEKNRIHINSRLNIDSKDIKKSGIKIVSKLDSNQTGSGTMEVVLDGGNFNEGTIGYKPDNYALKISTTNSDVVEDKFYISSAGSVFYPKEAMSFSHIKENSTNSYQNNNRWYLFSNIDMVKTDLYGTARQVSFANDRNEIIIDPIGFPEGGLLCVGLQLNSLLGISYQDNLINIGETFKINIRSSNPNIKIDKVGITYVGGFSNTTYANYFFPDEQVYTFPTGTTTVELVLVKQVAGNNPGDLVYFKGDGESGVWMVKQGY